MSMTIRATRAFFVGALALSIGAAPAAWAAGTGCNQKADQEQLGQTTGQAQKADQEQLGQTTGQAQKADQEQLGSNIGRAQKADQEQLGAKGNRQFAANTPGKC